MMVNESGHRIVFVGCVEAGYFTALHMIRDGLRPTAVVSLDAEQALDAKVSGYQDLFQLPGEMVRYRPKTYGMKSEEDLAFFREGQFDLLVVLGWQRLIPDEIIAMLRCGGITVHGSGPGLPKGRGRSPMNWALIEGHDRFHLSLLTLSSGADTGRILDTLPFDIFSTDTIRTLYYKNAYAAAAMMVRTVPGILAGRITGIEQDERLATVYPKRTPEDGRIKWGDSARMIERLIRAVTRPYPGAFCGDGEERITVWCGQLFDSCLNRRGMIGTVDAVFADGAFLVITGDGLLLVTDYEGRTPSEGEVLP